MKKMVRCKACGFLMEEGKYGACPACGVADKMFEPYEDKVPENRRKILSLDIHPVMVHFPVAFSFLTVVLTVVGMVVADTGGPIFQAVFGTLQVISILYPLFVLVGFLTGLLDGYYRYKSLGTKLLVRKMIIGVVFFALTIVLPFLIFSGWETNSALQITYLIVSIGAFVCAMVLGLIGAKLVHGVMVGPFVKKKKPTVAAQAS